MEELCLFMLVFYCELRNQQACFSIPPVSVSLTIFPFNLFLQLVLCWFLFSFKLSLLYLNLLFRFNEFYIHFLLPQALICPAVILLLLSGLGLQP